MRAKPLWNYALRVYPPAKTELLTWQDRHSLVVNDLIVMSFIAVHQLSLPNRWWQHPRLLAVRKLITRIRDQRRRSGDETLKAHWLKLEIECEAIDIAILASLIASEKVTELNLSDYGQAHLLTEDETMAVAKLISQLPLEGGVLDLGTL